MGYEDATDSWLLCQVPVPVLRTGWQATFGTRLWEALGPALGVGEGSVFFGPAVNRRLVCEIPGVAG